MGCPCEDSPKWGFSASRAQVTARSLFGESSWDDKHTHTEPKITTYTVRAASWRLHACSVSHTM